MCCGDLNAACIFKLMRAKDETSRGVLSERAFLFETPGNKLALE